MYVCEASKPRLTGTVCAWSPSATLPSQYETVICVGVAGEKHMAISLCSLVPPLVPWKALKHEKALLGVVPVDEVLCAGRR